MHEHQLRFPKLQCVLHERAPSHPLLQFWTRGLAAGLHNQKSKWNL